VVLNALVFGALAFCWWYEMTHPHRVVDEVVPQVACAHAHMSDAQMKAYYDGLNEEYFNNTLPHADVEWGEMRPDWMAETWHRGDGTFAIVINPAYNIAGKTVQYNIIHETCHVATMVQLKESGLDSHGPAWQQCMHDLADKKAMENVW
jgi:hypothetical protein